MRKIKMGLEEAEDLADEVREYFEVVDLSGRDDGTWLVTAYVDLKIFRSFANFEEWIAYREQDRSEPNYEEEQQKAIERGEIDRIYADENGIGPLIEP
jgi:hypothetical protein